MDSKLFDLEKRIIRLEAMLEAKEDLIDILTTVMRQTTVQPQPYVFPNPGAPVWTSGKGSSNGVDGANIDGLGNWAPSPYWEINCSANAPGKIHKPTGSQNTTLVDSNPMRLDPDLSHKL